MIYSPYFSRFTATTSSQLSQCFKKSFRLETTRKFLVKNEQIRWFSNEPYIYKKTKAWSEIIDDWVKKYQQMIGISEVIEAQDKVTMLTDKLIEAQQKRRHLQVEVESVHQQLLATHQQITKSELYSEDHYALFDKARQLNGKLKNLQEAFTHSELEERTTFTQLSSAIKFCHEKERSQAETTKYWSILISVVSAALASLVTSVNNWMRIKQIKDHATHLHEDTFEKCYKLAMSLKESGETKHNNENLLEKLEALVQDQLKKESEPIIIEKLVECQSQNTRRSILIVSATAIGGLIIGSVLGATLGR